MKALLKMHHTILQKVYLEDGSVIDIFDNPRDQHMDNGLYGVANVISTYHIDTLNVEDSRFAEPEVIEYIKVILAEDYNYNKDFKIEVV